MLEKGIILSPNFIFENDRLKILPLSGQTLRQCLLYWDKIEYPTNNVIHLGVRPDIQFLIDEGALQRTKVTFKSFSGSANYALIKAQIEVLKMMNDAEPGQWSLAQPANVLCLVGDKPKIENLIEFELHKCMPVPTSDVPFDEILEFKLRRRDEFISFKNFVGEIYLDIVNSNEIPRAKTQAMNRLEASIIDIQKATSESFAKRVFKSLSISLNPINVSVHGLAGMSAATLLGVPISLGAVTGSVMGAINFNLTKQSVPENMYQNQKGLAYLMKTSEDFKGNLGRNEL